VPKTWEWENHKRDSRRAKKKVYGANGRKRRKSRGATASFIKKALRRKKGEGGKNGTPSEVLPGDEREP